MQKLYSIRAKATYHIVVEVLASSEEEAKAKYANNDWHDRRLDGIVSTSEPLQIAESDTV